VRDLPQAQKRNSYKLKKIMFRKYYLLLSLIIMIAVGNIQIKGKTSSVISRTMKDIIWNISKAKGNVPLRFGSVFDLVEAMANDPGICQDVAREIQVVLYGCEYYWGIMTPPDMPSGRELHSIYSLMADKGMIDEYAQSDVRDVMMSILINKWEFWQLPLEVRKKIYVIYQIARSSDPKKLVTALVRSSRLTVIPYNYYNAESNETVSNYYRKTTSIHEHEETSRLILESSAETGEDVKTWAMAFGGALNDGAYSIQQTSDGGYIIAGFATFLVGPTGYDFCILKLSPSGNIEWQRAYAGSSLDTAHSIQQTADGGYIVAGSKRSSGPGSGDFWILKLSPWGDVEWQKTYGGSDSDSADSIQQVADEGYIVAGPTYSFGAGMRDFWILKLSSSGDVEWQKAYGGSDTDIAHSIQQTADGGYIVTGSTRSFGAGNGDFWILKLDSGGDVEWQKAYGGSDTDIAHSIQQTADGGYIVAGYTHSLGAGNGDFWILKLDSGGDVEWQRAYGGSRSDMAQSIQQTSDGGYIVAGMTRSGFGRIGSGDFLILKLDSGGYIDKLPELIAISKATVSDTSAAPQDTFIIPQDTDIVPQDTDINPQNTDERGRGILLFGPPLNFKGEKVLNRSLSQEEYINVLPWEANPNNESLNIVKYRIYRVIDGEDYLLDELNASTFEYWHRNVWKGKRYTYYIVAVNDADQESIPAYITVQ